MQQTNLPLTVDIARLICNITVQVEEDRLLHYTKLLHHSLRENVLERLRNTLPADDTQEWVYASVFLWNLDGEVLENLSRYMHTDEEALAGILLVRSLYNKEAESLETCAMVEEIIAAEAFCFASKVISLQNEELYLLEKSKALTKKLEHLRSILMPLCLMRDSHKQEALAALQSATDKIDHCECRSYGVLDKSTYADLSERLKHFLVRAAYPYILNEKFVFYGGRLTKNRAPLSRADHGNLISRLSILNTVALVHLGDHIVRISPTSTYEDILQMLALMQDAYNARRDGEEDDEEDDDEASIF